MPPHTGVPRSCFGFTSDLNKKVGEILELLKSREGTFIRLDPKTPSCTSPGGKSWHRACKVWKLKPHRGYLTANQFCERGPHGQIDLTKNRRVLPTPKI